MFFISHGGATGVGGLGGFTTTSPRGSKGQLVRTCRKKTMSTQYIPRSTMMEEDGSIETEVCRGWGSGAW